MIEAPHPRLNTSKVLTLADWGVAYDARFVGGITSDTLVQSPTRLDAEPIAGLRDWTRNGRHGTQATPSNQGTTSLGPPAALVTNGTSNSYAIGGSGTGNAAFVHGFMVVDWFGTIPGTARFMLSGNGTGDVQLRQVTVSGDVGLALGGVGVAIQRAVADGMRLIEYRWAANSQYLRVDANAATTSANATAPSDVQTRILSFNDGTSSMQDCTLYAWYQFQGTAFLDAGTITAVRNAFASEFGGVFTV